MGLAFLFACGSSPKDKKRQELRGRINEIQQILSKRSSEAIYGPPQMLQEWEEQNNRLVAERDSLEIELKKLDQE
jgi:hypothetical protein